MYNSKNCFFEFTAQFQKGTYSLIVTLEMAIKAPAFIEQVYAPRLQLPEAPLKQLESWANVSFKFARSLLEPTMGDVVFVIRAADDSCKYLYAYKWVLAGNSEYFETRMPKVVLILSL